MLSKTVDVKEIHGSAVLRASSSITLKTTPRIDRKHWADGQHRQHGTYGPDGRYGQHGCYGPDGRYGTYRHDGQHGYDR